jgi:hypothetical protein
MSSSSANSAHNTPRNSPRKVNPKHEGTERDKINSRYVSRPIEPNIVRDVLKDTYNKKKYANIKYYQILKKEPTNINKTLKKEIQTAIIVKEGKEREEEGDYIYTTYVVNTDIGFTDIILLKNGTALYNVDTIKKGKEFKVATGTRVENPIRPPIDHDSIRIAFSLSDAYAKHIQRNNDDKEVNPAEISGIVKMQEIRDNDTDYNYQQKMYLYWKEFIEVTNTLLKEPQQKLRERFPQYFPVQGGQKTKYLKIGSTRKKIYNVKGRQCVKDGKYKNGKDRYVSVASYKKKHS